MTSVEGPPVRSFTGIRYAQPPIGELRFRPPVVAPWTGPDDATGEPRRSVQPRSMLTPAGAPEGEDCLFLNVWAPEGATSLPVMVWFHGGSFVTGSGSLAWYDGTNLASRGVAVVTVNYRLGALGFLDLAGLGGDEWAGCVNVGLQDQALALTWVRDHIAEFGGDPTQVTIFGESAGAMSVAAHLGRPGSAGLFRRAVAQSGAAAHVQTADAGGRIAKRVVELLGGRLDRLRDLPADAFRELPSALDAEDADRDLPLPFRPTVDGEVLPVAPLDALAAGSSADVELLSGTTRDEMNLFRLMAVLGGAPADLPDDRLLSRIRHKLVDRGLDPASAPAVADLYRRGTPDATNAEVWSTITTDLTFRLPMLDMLDAHVGAGGRAWSYRFDHASTGFGGALGAAHAVEIPFVFETLSQPGADMMLGEMTPERRAFATSVADRWATFASAPDPADALTVPGTDVPWPAYDTTNRRQVVLDLESEVVERDGDDRRALWR